MELFCAIDVMDGQAVRLVKGEFDAATGFGDPLGLARRYLDAGARWLHVVDLDAARTGEAANRDVVVALAEAAHRRGAHLEAGGGLRDADAVDALLSAGADRVVLGTAAVEDPGLALSLALRHPGRVAAGFDYRPASGGGIAVQLRGWTESAAGDPGALLDAWAGAPLAALVVTAVERDGTREGPDTGGLAWVLDRTELDVVASGGVGTVSDLSALRRLRSSGRRRGIAGVVAGRALADGTIDVGEAVAACAASG